MAPINSSPSGSSRGPAPEGRARPLARLFGALLLVLAVPAPARTEAPAAPGAQPELAVSREDIILPRPSLLEGVAVPVVVRVRNLGDGEARGFEVQVADGAGQRVVPLKTFAIASVPPRSDVLLTVDWTPRGPGQHRVTVKVDEGARVPEGSRANNAASRTVVVLSEAQALRNLYAYGLQYVPRDSRDFELLEAEGSLVGTPPTARGAASLVAGLAAKAVHAERGVIEVIGLGLRPFGIVSTAVALPAARRAAVLEAQRWLGLIQEHRGRAGGGRLFGAVVVGEQALPDGSVLVKMEAPLR